MGAPTIYNEWLSPYLIEPSKSLVRHCSNIQKDTNALTKVFKGVLHGIRAASHHRGVELLGKTTKLVGNAVGWLDAFSFVSDINYWTDKEYQKESYWHNAGELGFTAAGIGGIATFLSEINVIQLATSTTRLLGTTSLGFVAFGYTVMSYNTSVKISNLNNPDKRLELFTDLISKTSFAALYTLMLLGSPTIPVICSLGIIGVTMGLISFCCKDPDPQNPQLQAAVGGTDE